MPSQRRMPFRGQLAFQPREPFQRQGPFQRRIPFLPRAPSVTCRSRRSAFHTGRAAPLSCGIPAWSRSGSENEEARLASTFCSESSNSSWRDRGACSRQRYTSCLRPLSHAEATRFEPAASLVPPFLQPIALLRESGVHSSAVHPPQGKHPASCRSDFAARGLPRTKSSGLSQAQSRSLASHGYVGAVECIECGNKLGIRLILNTRCKNQA